MCILGEFLFSAAYQLCLSIVNRVIMDSVDRADMVDAATSPIPSTSRGVVNIERGRGPLRRLGAMTTLRTRSGGVVVINASTTPEQRRELEERLDITPGSSSSTRAKSAVSHRSTPVITQPAGARSRSVAAILPTQSQPRDASNQRDNVIPPPVVQIGCRKMSRREFDSKRAAEKSVLRRKIVSGTLKVTDDAGCVAVGQSFLAEKIWYKAEENLPKVQKQTVRATVLDNLIRHYYAGSFVLHWYELGGTTVAWNADDVQAFGLTKVQQLTRNVGVTTAQLVTAREQMAMVVHSQVQPLLIRYAAPLKDPCTITMQALSDTRSRENFLTSWNWDKAYKHALVTDGRFQNFFPYPDYTTLFSYVWAIGFMIDVWQESGQHFNLQPWWPADGIRVAYANQEGVPYIVPIFPETLPAPGQNDFIKNELLHQAYRTEGAGGVLYIPAGTGLWALWLVACINQGEQFFLTNQLANQWNCIIQGLTPVRYQLGLAFPLATTFTAVGGIVQAGPNFQNTQANQWLDYWVRIAQHNSVYDQYWDGLVQALSIIGSFTVPVAPVPQPAPAPGEAQPDPIPNSAPFTLFLEGRSTTMRQIVGWPWWVPPTKQLEVLAKGRSQAAVTGIGLDGFEKPANADAGDPPGKISDVLFSARSKITNLLGDNTYTSEWELKLKSLRTTSGMTVCAALTALAMQVRVGIFLAYDHLGITNDMWLQILTGQDAVASIAAAKLRESYLDVGLVDYFSTLMVEEVFGMIIPAELLPRRYPGFNLGIGHGLVLNNLHDLAGGLAVVLTAWAYHTERLPMGYAISYNTTPAVNGNGAIRIAASAPIQWVGGYVYGEAKLAKFLVGPKITQAEEVEAELNCLLAALQMAFFPGVVEPEWAPFLQPWMQWVTLQPDAGGHRPWPTIVEHPAPPVWNTGMSRIEEGSFRTWVPNMNQLLWPLIQIDLIPQPQRDYFIRYVNPEMKHLLGVTGLGWRLPTRPNRYLADLFVPRVDAADFDVEPGSKIGEVEVPVLPDDINLAAAPPVVPPPPPGGGNPPLVVPAGGGNVPLGGGQGGGNPPLGGAPGGGNNPPPGGGGGGLNPPPGGGGPNPPPGGGAIAGGAPPVVVAAAVNNPPPAAVVAGGQLGGNADAAAGGGAAAGGANDAAGNV